MAQLIPLLLAVASGILSHLIFFIRGEWHLWTGKLLGIYSLAALSILSIEIQVLGLDSFEASISTLTLGVAYTAALFTSIIAYRVFFHKLRTFQGPFIASVTKFWHVWHCRTSKNHLVLDKLREEYGNIVRTGPNELTIFDPLAVVAFNEGSSNPCGRSAWYDFLYPLMGLVSIRDKKLHDSRRRIWDHGFSTKALREYQPQIQRFAEELEGHIASSAGIPFDMRSELSWFSFDIMGYFAFAKSFNMLRDRKWHHAVTIIRNGMELLGYLTPVPWLGQLAFNFAFLPSVQDWKAMIKWCYVRMSERLLIEPEQRDISSWLIQVSKDRKTLEQDMNLLIGDAITLTVAGSDTIASTLTFLFYHLALEPQQADKVFKELQTLESIYSFDSLKQCSHLNAVIQETLRLHPPVLTGGLRTTPPEGFMFKNRFIPGNVTICTPQYSISRDPTCFESPNDFISERWSSRPELIKDKRAYAPFSIGRANCVGQYLAMDEMRFVVALLVFKHTFKIASGGYRNQTEKDTRDCFTAVPGKLELVFQPRAKS